MVYCCSITAAFAKEAEGNLISEIAFYGQRLPSVPREHRIVPHHLFPEAGMALGLVTLGSGSIGQSEVSLDSRVLLMQCREIPV